MNFSVFVRNGPKNRHLSPKHLQQSLIFTNVASALQGFYSTNPMLVAPGIAQTPSYEAAQLQHSTEFVEK